MNIKGKNYDIKIGLKSYYKLKEVYNIHMNDLTYDVTDLTKLTHVSLNAYHNADVTIDDVIDAFDADMATYKEAMEKTVDFLNEFIELNAGAKN